MSRPKRPKSTPTGSEEKEDLRLLQARVPLDLWLRVEAYRSQRALELKRPVTAQEAVRELLERALPKS